MNGSVEHKIYWEINTIKPRRSGLLGKLADLMGHVPAEVHTYVMNIEVSSKDGDTIDSTLESIMRQLKNISTSDTESKIVAHNGIKKIQFIRNDMV